jgi:hypothetical protein
MSIFSFKKRKKKNTIANKLNSILKYRRKLILPVFLFTLIISAASIITLANFGGGQTDDTPNLQRGLVGHWTMDSSSYVEGTENLVLNPSFSDGTTNNWTASGLGGVTNNGYFSSHSYDLISAEGTAHLLRNNVNLSSGTYYMTVWYENIEGQVPYFWTTGFNGSINIINDFSSGPGLKKAEVIIQATDTTNHPSIRYAAGSPADRLEGQVRIYGIQIEEKLHPTPFVDGTRQTRLADSTPYENHGTSDIYNSPSLVSDRSGKEKGAMEFNNVTRPRISFPEISFEDSEPHSGSMWVKINDGITGSPIGGFGWSNMIRLTSTAFQYRPGGGSAQTIASFSSINDNNWHLISWTVESNNNISVYVDGEFEGSSILNDTNIYYDSIGNGYVDHPDYNLAWNGYIDDVRIYDRVLLSEEISLLYDSYKPQLQVSSLNSGLVGHWTLDEVDYNPSTNRVSDLTPYSNHGLVNNNILFTKDRFQKEGGAIMLDRNDYISINNSENLKFTPHDSFSLGGWISIQEVFPRCYTNPDRWLAQNTSFVGRGSTSGSVGIGFQSRWHNNGNCSVTPELDFVQFITGSRGVSQISYSTSAINFDEFYHIFFVYTPGMQYTYINGILVDSRSNISGLSGSFQDANWLIIGPNAVPGGNGQNGAAIADDVRIYNRALSSQEISQLYKSYRPKVTPNLQKGLVLDMPLTSVDYNPSTERVSDRTPYGNHGTNHGAVFDSSYTSFNGTSNRINLGNIDYDYPNFTISVWAKSPTNSSTQTGFPIHVTNFIGKGNWNSTNNWYIGYKGSGSNPATNLSFVYGIGWSSGPSYSVNNFDLSEWNHFVGIASETKQKLYLNGQLVDSVNTSHVSVSNDFNLEIARSSYTPRFFSGHISNIKAFNRALSAQEVELLYARGR